MHIFQNVLSSSIKLWYWSGRKKNTGKKSTQTKSDSWMDINFRPQVERDTFAGKKLNSRTKGEKESR